MDLTRFAWCYLSPRGRLSARAFRLAFVLIVTVEALVLHIAQSWSDSADKGDELMGFVVFASVWPMLALEWKRLQDIGWPGWYVLAASAGFGIMMVVALWPAIIASLILFAGLAFVPGTPGANPFGPAPAPGT